MITTFDELMYHHKHEVKITTYGTNGVVMNASLECITCNMVLFDLEPGDELDKILADELKPIPNQSDTGW